jgi:RNA polymerase sigma factor (sigma-70 family)
MPTERQAHVFRLLCRAATDDLGDGELLERYIAGRDEASFEALLRRHGPMVLGVCRRILGNEADAEDAFQATFLVLVRKAATVVPRALVGNWLYGVARNTARKAKTMSGERRAKELRAGAAPRPQPAGDVEPRLFVVLDEELGRLPDKYRVPVVLCDLEGKPYKEAAKLIGCPQGTLSGRLMRARALLARRLARHGLAPSGAALAAALAPERAAALPPALLASSLKAASALAAGASVLSATASPEVAALTEGVLKMMFLNKLRAVAGGLLALCVVCVGSAAALWSAEGSSTAPAQDVRGQPQAVRTATDSRLEGPWADLASPDEVKAMRAALALAASKEVVPFLRDRLKPVKVDPQRVAQLISQLDDNAFAKREAAAAELDYLGEYIRADLEKALAKEPAAEVQNRLRGLLKRLANVTSGPTPNLQAAGAPDQPKMGDPRARPKGAPQAADAPPGGQWVPAFNPMGDFGRRPAGKGSFQPEGPTPAPRPTWVRAARAAIVLEQLGTPEATRLLEILAGGESDALPTQAAKAALDRQKK